MEVIITGIMPKPNGEYYIHFEYLGQKRSTLITKAVQKYHKITTLEIGQRVEVWKQAKSERIFYSVRRVIDRVQE